MRVAGDVGDMTRTVEQIQKLAGGAINAIVEPATVAAKAHIPEPHVVEEE